MNPYESPRATRSTTVMMVKPALKPLGSGELLTVFACTCFLWGAMLFDMPIGGAMIRIMFGLSAGCFASMLIQDWRYKRQQEMNNGHALSGARKEPHGIGSTDQEGPDDQPY